MTKPNIPKIHDKLDIADEMLEVAIHAFLDTGHYFVAINLANVAEELYGKFIKLTGGESSQQSLVKAAQGLASSIWSDGPPCDKDLINASVRVKNDIKHLDTLDQRYLEVDVEDEARAAIGCALTNHTTLGREPSPTTQRFYDYAQRWSVAQVSERQVNLPKSGPDQT